MNKRLFFCLAILLISSLSFADECSQKTSKSDISILLVPFSLGKNTTNAPTTVLPLLLKDYLSHVSGIAPTFGLTPTVSNLKTQYVLKGILTRKGSGFELTAKLFSTEGDTKEVMISAGLFDFPATMNDLLTALTEKTASAVGRKYNEKKVLPYLNKSASAEAYLSYASAIQEMTHAPDKAVALFQQAIQKDYNYVPAYVGLAEALARAGAPGRARVELMKAKLLNPVIVGMREDCIESLTKKESHR